MESSIPFHTLVILVDAEDIKNEKIRTLELALEIKNVTIKLESQSLSASTYDSKLETMFKQTTGPNNEGKSQFPKYSEFCHKSNHSIPNCFSKQRKDEERKRKLLCPLKSTVNSFIQSLKHTSINII